MHGAFYKKNIHLYNNWNIVYVRQETLGNSYFCIVFQKVKMFKNSLNKVFNIYMGILTKFVAIFLKSLKKLVIAIIGLESLEKSYLLSGRPTERGVGVKGLATKKTTNNPTLYIVLQFLRFSVTFYPTYEPWMQYLWIVIWVELNSLLFRPAPLLAGMKGRRRR